MQLSNVISGSRCETELMWWMEGRIGEYVKLTSHLIMWYIWFLTFDIEHVFSYCQYHLKHEEWRGRRWACSFTLVGRWIADYSTLSNERNCFQFPHWHCSQCGSIIMPWTLKWSPLPVPILDWNLSVCLSYMF